VAEVHPGRDQDCAGGEGNALVTEDAKERKEKAAAGRVACKDNGFRRLLREEVEVACEDVIERTWEWKLRC